MGKTVDLGAGVLKLRGVVQHYEWGGRDFIPQLLGIPNPERKPFAELWIGAHPKAPSTVETGGEAEPLDRFIASAADVVLGPIQANAGGRLPYLLKVLDVAKMLSIQAHPDRAHARDGFARENRAGINGNAADRNYKDENHKPEIGVALTDFWMLHGFRPLEEIAASLRELPELCPIMPELSDRLAPPRHDSEKRRELLRELYVEIMTMSQDRVNALLSALLRRLRREQPSDKDGPDYWAVRAAADYPGTEGNYDRGIFSIYLLNLIHLRPGQGTFQPAGLLHAYLEGANIELMANSDNVLRGGLTPKHIDTTELLKILRFESGKPQIIEGTLLQGMERVYRTPAEEFELSRIEIAPDRRYVAEARRGPETILALDGSAILTASGRETFLARGSSVLVLYGTRYEMEAQGGPAAVFKAALPEA